ncbi:hypothetical protein BJ508DRAFT_87023 [Ascobolus immersus RN42]|uniref:Uncharacterized protein n=1 Tax=Ascobolus immersus RN42 TaxID=1160509 RepID=A0A3N4I9A4_ASCIM|nr:hypothetical protein BJ508DRAFT_87023 [Ascobolus immersus RN42]
MGVRMDESGLVGCMHDAYAQPRSPSLHAPFCCLAEQESKIFLLFISFLVVCLASSSSQGTPGFGKAARNETTFVLFRLELLFFVLLLMRVVAGSFLDVGSGNQNMTRCQKAAKRNERPRQQRHSDRGQRSGLEAFRFTDGPPNFPSFCFAFQCYLHFRAVLRRRRRAESADRERRGLFPRCPACALFLACFTGEWVKCGYGAVMRAGPAAEIAAFPFAALLMFKAARDSG